MVPLSLTVPHCPSLSLFLAMTLLKSKLRISEARRTVQDESWNAASAASSGTSQPTTTASGVSLDMDLIRLTQADTPFSKGGSTAMAIPDEDATSRSAWLRKQVGLELRGHVFQHLEKWAGDQYTDKDLFKSKTDIDKFLKSEPLYDYAKKEWTDLLDEEIEVEKDLYGHFEKIIVAILASLTMIPPASSPGATTNTPNVSQDSPKSLAEDHSGSHSEFAEPDEDSSSLPDIDDPTDTDYIPESTDSVLAPVRNVVAGNDGTREVRRGDSIHFMHLEDFEGCDQYTSPDLVIRATGPSFEVPKDCKVTDLLRALGYTNIASFMEVKLDDSVDIQDLLEQAGTYARYRRLV